MQNFETHIMLTPRSTSLYCCLSRSELFSQCNEDLIMLTKRLARALEAVSPNNELSPKAMEYIRHLAVQHYALR